MKDKLKTRYKDLDTNGDGCLDFAELSDLLRKGNPMMPEAEIQVLFRQVDKDSSGTVEFDEFVDYLFGQEKRKSLLPPTGQSKAGRSRSSSRATSKSSERPSPAPQLKRKTSSRASSAASSRKSAESWSGVPDSEVSTGQRNALQDLAKWLAKDSISMVQLVGKLLDNVRAREGGLIFTQELREAVTLDVLKQEFPHLDVAQLREATLGKASELFPKIADVVLSVVLELGKKTGTPFEDIAGQVLWRYRFSDPLQQDCYKGLVVDIRWILKGTEAKHPSIVEMASMTFKELTMKDGGKMHYRSWMKLVELIRRNPILHERFKRNDADRLWHNYSRGAARQDQRDVGASIKIKEFPRMLLELSQQAEVHPIFTFMAVGCHCEDLASRREQGLELVPSRRPGTSDGTAESRPGTSDGTATGASPSCPIFDGVDPKSKSEGARQDEVLELERGWDQYAR